MKLLFLTDSLSELDGVGRYSFCLIEALEALCPGLEVHVLLGRKHRPTSERVPRHWRVEVALPPDYFFYMNRARFWASLLHSSLSAARAARGATLVHAIKDYPHSLVGLLAARSAGIPCVATAHGTYSVQPLLDPRHRRLARWTYRRLDGLISVSDYTRRRLLELVEPQALARAELRVIPNCVEAESFPAPAWDPARGARPWQGLDYSLSIGEIKERKGHHLALAAWCQAARAQPALHHFVVGKLAGDEYQRQLDSIVAQAGLQSRVHFLGNVDEQEKNDLLRGAQLFVHTPVRASDGGFEGFGIVYLEASASGVPVIGTLDCGAEDAIVDGQTGFLVAPQIDAVRSAMQQLFADPGLRARMGQAGCEHARRNTWRKNAAEVLALYQQVLGRSLP